MKTANPTLTFLPLCTFVAMALLIAGCQPPGEGSPNSGAQAVSEEPVPVAEPAADAADTATAEKQPAEEKPATETPAAAPTEAKEEPSAKSTAMPKIPLGLKPFDVPEDNPMTEEKIALGKMLYFDTRLSKDNTISCATCHDPKMAWAEHKPTSEGIDDQIGPRNSPTVINTAYARAQFWDGREPTLEAQAAGPIENPIEMGETMDNVVAKLSKIPGYNDAFQKVFGTGVTKDGIVKAIATFERTILSGNSRYDRFMRDEPNALNDQEKRGWKLFHKNCGTCHTAPLFSNYSYVNAGIGMEKKDPDKGRMDATGKKRDLGKFRVPPLRDIEKTAPYFHDGQTATLEEAVAIMAAGGKENPNLSFSMKRVADANLTKAEQADIVAFLKTLNGEYPVIDPPQLP